jgi:hypothetical protein
MTRECQVRICEGLRVKFPGPTRQGRRSGEAAPRVRSISNTRPLVAPQRIATVQEESDVSAKRSGAVMYPACFRSEDCLLRDAAAMAAGPDVIC